MINKFLKLICVREIIIVWAVILLCITLLPINEVYADTQIVEQSLEDDNPADGDLGDTPGYNVEKARSENSSEGAADGNDLIDVSGRTYPDTTELIDTSDYYNLGNIENLGSYTNVCFTTKEDEVTRIQVIYQGTSPEIVFFDSAKLCYPGQNKTYEDGFCIVKRTKSEYSSINNTKYSMDVYYIEYPQSAGQWVAQISTVGAKEFIFSQTMLPVNWQRLSNEKEIAAEIDGPTYYSMQDTGKLTKLTEASERFIIEQDEIKIKAEEEEKSTNYSSLILIGTVIGSFALVFIVFKVCSNKKIKEEESKAKKEREMAEFKEARKKTKEQIAEELTENFAGEDWSDVPQKQWSTKPTIIEVAEERKESSVIKKRVSQIQENNAEYVNTLLKNESDVKEKDDKLPTQIESDPEINVILNPIVPNMSSGDDEDFF